MRFQGFWGALCIVFVTGSPLFGEELKPREDERYIMGLVDVVSGKEISQLKYEMIREFRAGDLFVVKKGGEVGLLDDHGREVCPIVYDDIQNSENDGVVYLWKDGKEGWSDLRGGIIFPVIYDSIEDPGYGDWVLVYYDGKTGIADRKGKVAIEPKYEKMCLPHSGKMVFAINGKDGLLDISGNIILRAEYTSLAYLGGNWCSFASNDRFGVIDFDGKVILKPEWDAVESAGDGFIKCERAKKWCLVDPKTRRMGKNWCRSIGVFSENLVCAKAESGKSGFLNKYGEWQIPARYGEVGEFVEGVASVRDHFGEEDGYYFIDGSGKEVLDTREYPCDAPPFFMNGTCELHWSGGEPRTVSRVIVNKAGVIQSKLNYISSPVAPNAIEVSENGRVVATGRNSQERVRSETEAQEDRPEDGMILISNGDFEEPRFGYAKANGEVLIEPLYEAARGFAEGRAWVMKDGRWGLIDNKGKDITGMKYVEAEEFVDGVARVRLANRWGAINGAGSVVVPFEFEEIGEFKSGYAVVKNNGEGTVIDVHGKNVFREWFREVEATGVGDVWVIKRKDGKYVCLDINGKEKSTEYDAIYTVRNSNVALVAKALKTNCSKKE